MGAIDLLVTDVVMPELGGRALAEALRKQRPSLRVLYVSGYTDDLVLRHGIEWSREPYLLEPFTPSVLAQKVREVLDKPTCLHAHGCCSCSETGRARDA